MFKQDAPSLLCGLDGNSGPLGAGQLLTITQISAGRFLPIRQDQGATPIFLNQAILFSRPPDGRESALS